MVGCWKRTERRDVVATKKSCPKNPWDVMGVSKPPVLRPLGCVIRRVWCFHRRVQDSKGGRHVVPPIPFHELQFAVDLNFEDAILGGSGSRGGKQSH